MPFGPYFAALPVTGAHPPALSSATNANPVVLTFAAAHGVANGGKVLISGGTGSWAAVNGTWTATVSSATILSIPVNSSGFGAVTGVIVGGVPQRAYVDQTSWDARVDDSVNWKGNVNGGGFTLSNVQLLSGSLGVDGNATLTFGSIPNGGASAPLTFTVAGANVGDPIVEGWPYTLEAGLSGRMLVSAPNTVQVQLFNFSGTPLTPAALQLFQCATGVGLTPGTATLTFGLIANGFYGVQAFPMAACTPTSRLAHAWPAGLESGLYPMMKPSATPGRAEVRLFNLSGAPLTPSPAVYKGSVL